MEEWEFFKVSLNSWQRGVNPLILGRPPPPPSYIAYPTLPAPFSRFCPPPTSLSPPTLISTVLSVFIFLWLSGWLHHIWCAILLNDNMHLHKSSLGTLVPEEPWCVFYSTRHQVDWGLTQCGFLLVHWFDITHTQTHTVHSWARRLTHPYKYIFTPPIMCSQQLPLLHWMIKWIIHWYQKFIFHNARLDKLHTLCRVCPQHACK